MKDRLAAENFIERSRMIHGGKYDYSLINYTGSKNKVLIKCNICGSIFEQTPSNHLYGKHGCPNCRSLSLATKRSKSTETFIQEARVVHGNKYDYSSVKYTNNKTKVKIKCNTCGNIFLQKPNSHLSGIGCPVCGHKKAHEKTTKTTEQFIHEAQEIHGQAYDYSLVEYVDNRKHVCIRCNICGNTFYQAPLNHLHGQGCPKCGTEKAHLKLALTASEFINRAKAVHGDKYDYSFVDYINNHSKVKIICNNCGRTFEQTPDNHLSGQGCRVCSTKRWNNERKMTQDDFVQKSLNVHGSRYDYSQVNYIDYHEPVKIICRNCGKAFMQRPVVHLTGRGCPYCRKSKGEIAITDLLLQAGINFETEKWYKDLYYMDKKHHLRYDFYLPDYNLLIEYNGRQHYEYVEEWHSEPNATFADQQARDKLKYDYAKDHNIRLLIVKYDDDIEEKIMKELKECKKLE